MQKINKYTDDLLVGLTMECTGQCFNIRNFLTFDIKVYTLDSNNFVKCSYNHIGNTFLNIIENRDNFFICITPDELQYLENGQLRCIIEYSVIATNFQDGAYNGSDFILIDQMLTDRDEKINIISKNGCC